MKPNVISHLSLWLLSGCLLISACSDQSESTDTPVVSEAVEGQEFSGVTPAAALPESVDRIDRPESMTPEAPDPAIVASVDTPFTVIAVSPGDKPVVDPVDPVDSDNWREPDRQEGTKSEPDCPSGYHWVEDDL